MARAVDRIERDIAALEEAVSAIAVELRSAYASYLTTLGQAVRQQLILASYHLCTQEYPEAFLSLSLSGRQQLQQAIRKLGQQASDQLHPHTDSPLPSNPIELAVWQQNLEEAIANTVKTVSRETNSLLQQSGILPKKLPSPLLEAASNASFASGEPMAGPPNLLNMVIETENHEDAEDSTATHIIAIHLRLSEIEFADAKVRAGRNQIRNLEVQARALGREYQKKQWERSVASAQAAWRAIWFDD